MRGWMEKTYVPVAVCLCIGLIVVLLQTSAVRQTLSAQCAQRRCAPGRSPRLVQVHVPATGWLEDDVYACACLDLEGEDER